MNQAKEIVSRNKGNINDLLNHIDQEIHLSAIIYQKFSDGNYKSFLKAKLIQLQEIKSELQEELDNYNKKLKKEE